MLGTALRAIYIAIKLNDSDFYRKLSQVNQATDEAIKKVKQMNNALEELGKYMAGVGAVGQAGIGLAVKQFADFEQAFVNLKRVMPSDRDFERIQKSAEVMAKYYGRSVEDIIGVMELWARQGKNTEDQLEKLTNATLLWATAEGLDAREATEYLTYILNGFSMSASDAIRVVDALNEVSNNFATDSVKLAQTLQEAAGTAAEMGVTFEQLVGYATALHAAGYEAGEAGNFLSYMFSKLRDKSVVELLEQAGIAVYDSTGHFRSASAILSDLAKKWDYLDDKTRHAIASQITVGGRIAMFYALFKNWDIAIKATNTALHSQGSAAREASRALQTLHIELNRLKTSLMIVGAHIGKTVVPLIKPFIKLIEALADAFTKLPEPIQNAIGVGIAFSTMLMLVGGGAILLRAKLIELIGHLATLGLVELQTSAETLTLGGALRILAVQGFKSSIGAIFGFARALFTAQVGLMGLSIPLLPLIAGIGALIGVILALQDIMVKGWEHSRLKQALDWLLEKLPFLKPIAESVGNAINWLRQSFDWLAKFIGGAINWIRQAINRLGPLKYLLLGPVGGIVYLMTHFAKLKQSITSLPDAISQFLDRLGPLRYLLLGPVGSIVILMRNMDRLKSATSSALIAIKSLWDKTIGWIITKIDEFITKIKQTWEFITKSPIGKALETAFSFTPAGVILNAIKIVQPKIKPVIEKPEMDKRFYEEGSVVLKVKTPKIKPEIEKPELSWLEQLYLRVKPLFEMTRIPELMGVVRYIPDVIKPEVRNFIAGVTYIPKLVKPEITHELTKITPTHSQFIRTTTIQPMPNISISISSPINFDKVVIRSDEDIKKLAKEIKKEMEDIAESALERVIARKFASYGVY